MLPAVLQMCANAYPEKGKPQPQPHTLFPHQFEPPPKRKVIEIDARSLSRWERMRFRLDEEFASRRMSAQEYGAEVTRLERMRNGN